MTHNSKTVARRVKRLVSFDRKFSVLSGGYRYIYIYIYTVYGHSPAEKQQIKYTQYTLQYTLVQRDCSSVDQKQCFKFYL